MEVTINELKMLVKEGKNLGLTEDFLFKGMLLVSKDRLLTQKDVDRLDNITNRKIDIKLTKEKDSLVSISVKKAMTHEILNLLKTHTYYNKLKDDKRKEVTKVINSLYPHSDYASYALQHIHAFSKELFTHSIHIALISIIIDLTWQKEHNNGLIDSMRMANILFGGLLHDVGYLTIDKKYWAIKRGKKDFNDPILRSHPSRGYDLLIRDQVKHCFKTEVLNIVQHHEERVDQSGFPTGLPGSKIDSASHIVGLANEFEHVLNNELSQSASYLEMCRYFKSRKSAYDKNCLDILCEEFKGLD
ncbi:MAG: hypothetical protein IEMM0008_0682 [bacterium]|nr:MAG: hypothetical protein IEMM0008_0682 [bacterium]